jgi:hypothetical protein
MFARVRRTPDAESACTSRLTSRRAGAPSVRSVQSDARRPRRRVAAALVAALLLAASPAPLDAQSLSEKLGSLFRFGDCDEALCLTLDDQRHDTHYLGSAVQANGALLAFLGDAIAVSVGGIPISATSGGATFSFENGVPVQTAVSAGPIFAERAQTLGRRRLLLGVNTTGISFENIRGVSMNDIDLNFTHVDVPIPPPGLGSPEFENDVINVQPSIDIYLQVTSFYATYGLTDNIDVSVAVPLVYSSLDATSVGTIISTLNPSPHGFGTPPNVSPTASGSVEGSATGIGDVAARAKVNLRSGEGLGLALLADTRLPTGNEDNFAGSGELTARALGIVSGRMGNFSPHLNAGYALRTGDFQNDAILATVGFDQLLAPWMTAAVDLITEWQVGESGLALPTEVHFTQPQEHTVTTTNLPDQRDDVINASAGARFVLSGFSIVANALVPLRDAGMQANVVWTLGLERTF